MKQFENFEPEVYYGIIASIIVISFVTSLYKQSLKSFFTTFWAYLSVILSDYYSIKVKTFLERTLAGIWLLSCTIFLAAFSGHLREQILRPAPIEWINSWEDLHEWKDMTIEVNYHSNIKSLIKSEPDHPFSKDFKNRLQFDEEDEKTQKDSFNIDIEGMKSGRVAVSYPSVILQILKHNFIDENFKEDIDFHISQSGFTGPFFTISNPDTFNDSMAKKYDLV